MSLTTVSDCTIGTDEMRSRYCYSEAERTEKDSKMEKCKRNKERKHRNSRSKLRHTTLSHPINFYLIIQLSYRALVLTRTDNISNPDPPGTFEPTHFPSCPKVTYLFLFRVNKRQKLKVLSCLTLQLKGSEQRFPIELLFYYTYYCICEMCRISIKFLQDRNK